MPGSASGSEVGGGGEGVEGTHANAQVCVRMSVLKDLLVTSHAMICCNVDSQHQFCAEEPSGSVDSGSEAAEPSGSVVCLLLGTRHLARSAIQNLSDASASFCHVQMELYGPS